MENIESKIKTFEKLSKMLVIKPVNELFSQFSDMLIDDIKVNDIKYEKDAGLYKIYASISIVNSLESKASMEDIFFEISHMFLNTSEYVFTENFILLLKFQSESHSNTTNFDCYGVRQSNSESLDSIKHTLEYYTK
jgi:hypothetical protein